MNKCKVCKSEFTPVRPLQSVCGPMCGLAHARQATEKKKAKEAQEDRNGTMTSVYNPATDGISRVGLARV